MNQSEIQLTTIVSVPFEENAYVARLEGREDCLVIDPGGNVKRLGYFEDDPPWSLDITTKDPGEVGTRLAHW